MSDEEQVEMNKTRDAAREQALHSISYGRVNGADPQTGALSGGKTGDTTYGKVRVWFKKQKKYALLWSVDASEAIASGGAVLDKPENEPAE